MDEKLLEKESLAVSDIAEIKDEFESLKLFENADLIKSAKSVFGFSPAWIDYKEYNHLDTVKGVLLNSIRWDYQHTLMHFIATYEYKREKNPAFKMTDFKRIGPYKAGKILNTLYGLSKGLYDPEPEQRRAGSMSLDNVKRGIRLAESFGVKKSEILKIIDNIYDKQ